METEAALNAAATHAAHLGARLPLWSILPFAGILISIALLPLVAPHFWHRHYPRVSAFWALAFAIPFLAAFRNDAAHEILHVAAIDYVPFIILLWALFTVAGGIYVGGTFRGTPRSNAVLLLVGTLLASWIGTTGASMVMIRPVLRANAWRRHQVHVVVFFIFLVANVGGALTPLGDPPLFLGFLHGVPFFWVTKGILPHTLVVSAFVLLAFWLLDSRLFRRESESPPEPTAEERKPRIEGSHNLLLLGGVMAAVLFSGNVELGAISLGRVAIERQNLVRDAALLMLGFASLRTTARTVRAKNGFGWGPIREVAVLFAGIFLTIVPALQILQAGEHGALAGLMRTVREPAHYFWIAGALSSFLDNAPTYLAFFNAALGSAGLPESAVPALLGYADPALRDARFERILAAISAGAVFMGANTYIGNAPNFMVKAIAEEAGVPMPSFFGYMVRYSIPILIPSFLLVSLLFF